MYSIIRTIRTIGIKSALNFFPAAPPDVVFSLAHAFFYNTAKGKKVISVSK
jgi:hypothetical protein